MKKTFLILLCLSLVLAACGGTEEETVEESAVVEEEVETLDSPAVTTADVLDKLHSVSFQVQNKLIFKTISNH